MDASRQGSDFPWNSPGWETPGAPSGLWSSGPSSQLGSFRADENDELALCCSMSESEDTVSEYSHSLADFSGSEGHHTANGSDDGRSPATSTTELSGGSRLTSPAYLSSRDSTMLSVQTVTGAGTNSTPTASPAQADASAPQAVLEDGAVSPKRRNPIRNGLSRKVLTAGETGKIPAFQSKQGPQHRGGFQSCLRPGLGAVRTIIEEDEEDLDEDDEDVDAPTGPTHQVQQGGVGIKPQKSLSEARSDNEILLASSEIRDQQVDASRRGGIPHSGHDSGGGCLCPGATHSVGGSSAQSCAESPPGSPDRLSAVSSYFCGLPTSCIIGGRQASRRRMCGLCGRRVGRRAPHCTLCRHVVYCDRRCLEQHQPAHFRSCPGASARRLREAARGLREENPGEEDSNLTPNSSGRRSVASKASESELPPLLADLGVGDESDDLVGPLLQSGTPEVGGMEALPEPVCAEEVAERIHEAKAAEPGGPAVAAETAVGTAVGTPPIWEHAEGVEACVAAA